MTYLSCACGCGQPATSVYVVGRYGDVYRTVAEAVSAEADFDRQPLDPQPADFNNESN